MQTKNPNVEEVDDCIRELERTDQTIKLTGVNKVFDGGKQAVEDLNLTIYNDQIFVLLGHNGAGKTTTISMLTGLLQPSSGTIEALGLDVETDMA
jgi:ATP-binding cassette subfamily A (ABC1) protein 3